MNKLFRFYSMFIKWYSVVIKCLFAICYEYFKSLPPPSHSRDGSACPESRTSTSGHLSGSMFIKCLLNGIRWTRSKKSGAFDAIQIQILLGFYYCSNSLLWKAYFSMNIYFYARITFWKFRGTTGWAHQERSWLISSTSSNLMKTPNSLNESPSLVL